MRRANIGSSVIKLICDQTAVLNRKKTNQYRFVISRYFYCVIQAVGRYLPALADKGHIFQTIFHIALGILAALR